MPRRTGKTAATKSKQLLAIVNYLDPEAPSHKRYQRTPGATFCNVYAYDYCYLAGVYLPRVWWKPALIPRLQRNEKIAARWNNTVDELTANKLHDWFDEFGASFGWRHEIDLDVLQNAANNGEVCVIVAKREGKGHGHIVAVVPEHDGFAAARNATGQVTRPLESQAGSRNHRYFTKSTQWWKADRFASATFWRHV